MDRITWLEEMRRNYELQYDRSAPRYCEKYGLYSNIAHRQIIREFLGLLSRRGKILEAACGAGRYLPSDAGHRPEGTRAMPILR